MATHTDKAFVTHGYLNNYHDDTKQNTIVEEVLWENSNPDADQPSATYTLSKNIFDYKFIVFVARAYQSAVGKNATIICKIEPNRGIGAFFCEPAISGGNYFRNVNIDTSSMLNIPVGYEGTTPSNKRFVLQKVIGIKY